MTDRGRSTRDDVVEPLRVLAIAAHRPEEVINTVEAMEADAEVLSIDGDGGVMSRSLSVLLDTRGRIHRHDPDVILLDCHHALGAVVALLAMIYRIPLIPRLVGDNWRGIEEDCLGRARSERDPLRWIRCWTTKLVNEFIYSRADGFVVVSTELKEIVRRRTGCQSDQVGIVPVPITKTSHRETVGETDRESFDVSEETVVLTVTNLQFRAKLAGVKAVIRELDPVLEHRDDLAYLIAGGGRHYDDLLDHLDAEIDDEDVRERIYALGYVEEVEPVYALADVFAYVSYRDGYPNVVLEAQLAGLPVVANEAHGMCDQITDGETGFLVDESIPGNVRDHVQRLLTNTDERERLGEQARKRVLAENDPASIGAQLDTVLHQLLNDGARPPGGASHRQAQGGVASDRGETAGTAIDESHHP